MDVFGVPSLDDELFTKRPGGRISKTTTVLGIGDWDDYKQSIFHPLGL